MIKYEVASEKEDQYFPTNKDLAKLLNYAQTKTNNLLKSLHRELINSTQSSPLNIMDYVHVIHIYIPRERRRDGHRKRYRNPLEDEYTWVEMKLPYTPRLGPPISQ